MTGFVVYLRSPHYSGILKQIGPKGPISVRIPALILSLNLDIHIYTQEIRTDPESNPEATAKAKAFADKVPYFPQ